MKVRTVTREQMRHWSLLSDDQKKARAKQILENPRKKNPGHEIPESDDLRQWDGSGMITDSFLDEDGQYVVVHYYKRAPSDLIPYIYIYDDPEESEDEDAEV